MKDKDFEVWDISDLCSEIQNNMSWDDIPNETKSVYKLNSKKELIKKILKHSSEDVYFLIEPIPDKGIKNLVVGKIDEGNGHLVYKVRNPNIFQREQKNALYYTKKTIMDWGRRLRNTIFNRKYIGYDYVIRPTKYEFTNKVYKKLSTSKLEMHCHDYDMSIPHLESDIEKKDRVVFLAQNLPHHIEVKTIYGDVLNPSMYYDSVKNYIRKVKNITGLKYAVIAEHPNANIKKAKKRWGKYNVKKYKTAKLVNESKAVISQGSFSTIYAIIFKKTLFFMITSQMEKNDMNIKNVKNISTKIGGDFDISGPNGINGNIEPCPKNNYGKMLNKYIKEPNTPNENSILYFYKKVVE